MADFKERVLSEIDNAWDEEVEFLAELVRHKSTLFNESGVQHAMARKLKQLGLDVDVFEADINELCAQPGFSPVEWGYQGRPQVVGLWKSETNKKGRSLVLNGHADVVSAEPERLWSYDPWQPKIVGDRMYGRGTGDMKAGLAAIVYAVSSLRKLGVRLDGDVIIQSVIEEECSGNGTLACITKGYTGDAALIPDTVNPGILTAELGVLWFRTVVTGSAGHVRTTKTVNAIEKSFEVIKALKELEKKWNLESHPAFSDIPDPIRCNIGIIKGGDWPSAVPAECEFVTRISAYPGCKPREVQQKIIEFLHERLDGDDWFKHHFPQITWYGHLDEGFSIKPEHEFYELIANAHRQITGKPVEYFKLGACTDARFWVLYQDLPATCYGTAGGNIHGIDEYVQLPSLKETTKVIASLILDWCGCE